MCTFIQNRKFEPNQTSFLGSVWILSITQTNLISLEPKNHNQILYSILILILCSKTVKYFSAIKHYFVSLILSELHLSNAFH